MPHSRLALLCLLTIATPALAAGPSECIPLNAKSQLARARGAVLIKHEDQRYLLRLESDCRSVVDARHLRIVTGDKQHLLCPQGSEAASRLRRCPIASIESIDAAGFERARLHRY